ncbi:bacteriocin immunity protein [Lactiplantibacillus sp. WILCCON 0030]|uniref:Bacteriocin immunity protein n=1 Tax=Lactiplantibacillus brownii TaxID=3069269 RepID=A0ABU1A5E9_9LACO|nr:bacteriocin immunity protein [Lactiplantibacillus brownii]MDQ7936151.1 bacteriocin immunity protein [Lactiplantibacillus brownii]
MVELNSKRKYYPIVLILFIAGYLGAIFLDYHLNWLTMFMAGIVSLIILYGFSNLKLFFQPLSSPKLRILLKYALLMFVMQLVVIVFISIIYPQGLTSVNNVPLNPNNAPLNINASGIDYPLIERIWIIFTMMVSIVGEEVGMASISVPMIHLLSQTKLKKFAWPIVNIMGCILFGSLHIPHYHFNLIYPLIVGITRYPMTASWRSANTLRSSIYIHWLADSVLIIGTLI